MASESPPPAYAETVEEITRIFKSLPRRPSIEEVEAANSVLRTVETEEHLQLEEIAKLHPPQGVEPELFSVLQDVKRAMVSYRSYEQRKEAVQLVELDGILEVFDGLIQKASAIVSGEAFPSNLSGGDGGKRRRMDVIYEEKSADYDDTAGEEDAKSGYNSKGFSSISSSKGIVLSSGEGEGEGEKLNLMKVAEVIESTAKTEANVLDLRGKLRDNIEWLPLSVGKLLTISELFLSDNRIMALPASICSLKTLMKLDVRANQLINLPQSFGELQNLRDLDLSGNMLKSLPESFGNLKNLINLDLSSNGFSILPSIIGDLESLRSLNLETNDLEELPYTIGSCSSLVELRLDFNQLKALPEAVGKLDKLEILTLHYNRIKRLPSTIGNLLHLKEFDISFNELESIPESFGFLGSLKRLNVGKNFADLRMLPRSLGNLEMLEELDISDNQITTLPESFRYLSNLKNFRADQTPLEAPPVEIIKLGAQAVVQYMADLATHSQRVVTFHQTKKKKGFCSYICPLLCFGVGKA